MNDDFLRRAWRRPPAAFEKELRERLRQQELAPPPRPRPTWRLSIVSILVGGAALATATYLTAKHFSLLAPSASETRPPPVATPGAQSDANRHAANRTSRPGTVTSPAVSADPPRTPLGEHGGVASGTRDDEPSPDGSSSSGTRASGSDSATGSGSPTAAMVRIAVTPPLATLAKEISTNPRYTSSAQAEVANADAALLTLCADASAQPDVVIASRRISQQELDDCSDTGTGTVMEARLGHVASVISRAKAGNSVRLSADAILRAVLKRVPSPHDPQRLIDNPYTDWNQIDRSLEAQRIEVLGPPRDSEEFLVFAASILEPACDRYPWIRDLRSDDRSTYEQICYTLRDDGVYKSPPTDSNFVRQRLWADPTIVAVVTYPFYAANSADLAGSLLGTAAPTSASIVNGSYAGARPIYLYVSRARYVRSPAVSNFVNDYLRRQDFARYRWMTAPDGSTDSWRAFRPIQLIEVRTDERKEQP